MANSFISAWPETEVEEGANWAQCQLAALNKDTSSFLVPWPPPSVAAESSSTPLIQSCYGYPSWSMMPFGGVKQDRVAAATASSSHSQAEKRRRDKINAQLAALRKLIPKSDKMDKAALLGSVVEHVKDLKRKAVEVSKVLTVLPTDVDEVTIDYYLDQNETKDSNNIYIKASVCCDDRPELFGELTQALKGLKLTTVRADMSCLGGRIKSILVLCTEDNKEGACLNNTIQSLKGVLNRIVASSSTRSSYHRIRSKRQRFFVPSY